MNHKRRVLFFILHWSVLDPEQAQGKRQNGSAKSFGTCEMKSAAGSASPR